VAAANVLGNGSKYKLWFPNYIRGPKTRRKNCRSMTGFFVTVSFDAEFLASRKQNADHTMGRRRLQGSLPFLESRMIRLAE
jgi:hypothetical protein